MSFFLEVVVKQTGKDKSIDNLLRWINTEIETWGGVSTSAESVEVKARWGITLFSRSEKYLISTSTTQR